MTDVVTPAAVAAVETAPAVAPADSATAALVAAPSPAVLAQPAVAAVVEAGKDIATKDQELADLHARFDRLEALMNKSVAAAPSVTVQSSGEVLVQSKGPCGAIRAFNTSIRASKTFGRAVACAYKTLNGLKTLMVFVVTGGLALAQELDAIDLTPWFSALLPEGGKINASQAVVLMSVVGVLLRLVTKTAIFAKKKVIGGASDSAVDVPAAEEDTAA